MRDHKVGVALIEPVGSHGGMDYYDCGLAAGLGRNDVACVWYSCEKSRVRGQDGVELIRSFDRVWGKDPSIIRAIRYVKGLLASLADAKRRRLDVVHFHFFQVGILEFAGVLFARIFGFPVVVTVHDVESFSKGGRSRVLAKIAYSLCARLVVHNAVSERELRSLVGTGCERVRVVPHGSYIGLVPPVSTKGDSRQHLGIPGNSNVVLFFGQIKTVKGLDVLIRAFSRVQSTMDSCVLLIAGKVWKDDFSGYQALIEQAGLSERVALHIRYIDDEEIPMFYGAADVVVLPYRKIYQSGVLLMAMSLGVPVVTSDLPGMTEIVRDQVNGYLFRSEDVDHLAEVLSHAVGDEERRTEMTIHAKELMESEYAWSSIGRRLKDIYLEALAHQKRSSEHEARS